VRRPTQRLVIGSVAMIAPLVYGLVVFDPATAFGAGGVITGQLWFFDRLAWLYATWPEPTEATSQKPLRPSLRNRACLRLDEV